MNIFNWTNQYTVAIKDIDYIKNIIEILLSDVNLNRFIIKELKNSSININDIKEIAVKKDIRSSFETRYFYFGFYDDKKYIWVIISYNFEIIKEVLKVIYDYYFDKVMSYDEFVKYEKDVLSFIRDNDFEISSILYMDR